ncbi:hypothetical protein Tco_1343662 [Tanacetum coccineum]
MVPPSIKLGQRSPENTPLTNRASTSANPDSVICQAFMEVNYEVLKSLIRDHRRQVRNEDLHTESNYYNEDYDEEREMELRSSILNSGNGGNQPSTNSRGNLPPNVKCITTSWKLVQGIIYQCLQREDMHSAYTPSTITIPVVPATVNSPKVPERIAVKTILNMSAKNKEHYQSEKEAIHLLLTGIGDEIYSTVDACKISHDMWIAIERLQQGESLNIQDVKTNLFWEFGKFTSHDGESMESYYSRFYKMMNEMIRKNLTIAMMQVNVQFLQQLQLEWSRFVTIVKQHHDLDTLSYHKLFDILKHYQKEVNKISVERIATNANPLALVAAA